VVCLKDAKAKYMLAKYKVYKFFYNKAYKTAFSVSAIVKSTNLPKKHMNQFMIRKESYTLMTLEQSIWITFSILIMLLV